MNTVGMGGAGFTQALLLLLLGSVTVSCYEDLRDLPCRNETTYSAVPADRAQWTGSVELTLECDPGYDLPLNSPRNSTLICYPNGSTWLPDYLPDCNDKIVAKTATMTMIGSLSAAACNNLGPLTVSRTALAFGSSLRVAVTEKCKQSPLGDCIVGRASINCQANAGDTSPHLFLTASFSIVAATAWATYKTVTATVALSVLRDLEASAQSSHVNVSILPICQSGTVGVLRAGVEVVCRGCSLGHFLDEALKKCLPCPPGYYGDLVHSTSCKLCPGMSSYLGSPEWNRIIKPVPNRAYAISNCPILYKHPNGTLEVRVPMAIHAQMTRVETGKESEEPHEPHDGEDPALRLGSKLTVVALVLATLYVA